MDGCTCSGSGIVEKDNKLYECICAVLKRRAASMPPFVRIADLRAEHIAHKVHMQVGKSLFIQATWQDMKAIVKAVMICHANLFVRITSDNDILHAYVGAMSKKNKGENEATFETVGDFVGPPDLVIVRLNALTRPNKAAAGALEEAFVCRADQEKPIWLVSDIDRPFVSSSPAYSDTLNDLLDGVAKIRISPILPRNFTTGIFDLEPVELSRQEISKPQPVQRAKAAKEAKAVKQKDEPPSDPPSDPPSFDNDLSMYGAGVKKSGRNKFGRSED